MGRQRRSEILRKAAETESLIDSQEDEVLQVKSVKVSEIFFFFLFMYYITFLRPIQGLFDDL